MMSSYFASAQKPGSFSSGYSFQYSAPRDEGFGRHRMDALLEQLSILEIDSTKRKDEIPLAHG